MRQITNRGRRSKCIKILRTRSTSARKKQIESISWSFDPTLSGFEENKWLCKGERERICATINLRLWSTLHSHIIDIIVAINTTDHHLHIIIIRPKVSSGSSSSWLKSSNWSEIYQDLIRSRAALQSSEQALAPQSAPLETKLAATDISGVRSTWQSSQYVYQQINGRGGFK